MKEKYKYKYPDKVVATFGWNPILKEPFRRVYDFGYYSKSGCIVYETGERNMQDAPGFNLNQIRLATEEEIEHFTRFRYLK